MNEICIQNQKNNTTKKNSSNINNSVSSEKTNETYKNKINKVSFKKKLVEVIKVECWKSFNVDTAKDIYEQNSFDVYKPRKNKEICCICNIF